MEFERNLEKQIEEIISTWNDENIYAISFFVYANESSIYNGINNFPEFSVGYNTEEDCENASMLSEKRWNFAFWSQNNIPIISPEQSDMADSLLEWYRNQEITDIGVEYEDEMYDEDMNYIGKGPRGYIELLNLVSDIARKMQVNGSIKKRFGPIPIIVHELEYCWYVAEATKNANPNGEADVFLKALSEYFPE